MYKLIFFLPLRKEKLRAVKSFTQEDYIKSLYLLGKAGTDSVRTSKLSTYINTSASSVSDMLQKLQVKAFVCYEKYKGARLSKKGRSLALDIIRRHRLWEVFLHKKLHFDEDQVHGLAEQLEHVRSTELISRLDAYLGRPQHDPHGASIPTASGDIAADSRSLLWLLPLGEPAQVVALRKSTPALRHHLERIGLRLGNTIEVQAKEPYDGSLRVSLGDPSKICFLSEKVAQNVYVRKK